MNVIETTGLTKYYGKARGIDNLNLKVEEGEFFGFIGPNGAGKSTAVRTLLGLIRPSFGEALVLGKAISKAASSAKDCSYLSEIGYLSSEASFYNDMKVGEILSYSAGLRGKDCSHEAKKLCDRLELDTRKKVSQLSLGNRKKVGIVCAMQSKPRLYIMDEPTSGLDPLMQKEFFDLLHERQSEGATVFFSSHVLSEVQSNCTRAAIIRKGAIVAEGDMQSLAKTNAKRVSLKGVLSVPGALKVKSLSPVPGGISFLYQGDLKVLLAEISKLPISDMTIAEPELEEIFMHYYEKEDE